MLLVEEFALDSFKPLDCDFDEVIFKDEKHGIEQRVQIVWEQSDQLLAAGRSDDWSGCKSNPFRCISDSWLNWRHLLPSLQHSSSFYAGVNVALHPQSLPFPWEWSAQFGGSLRQWEKQECQQRLQRWGWDSSLICKRWKLMGVYILRVRIQNDSTVGVRQPYERLLWKGRFSLVCLVDIHVYWSMAFESVDPVAFEGTVARSLGQDWRPQRHQDALNLLWNHVIFS